MTNDENISYPLLEEYYINHNIQFQVIQWHDRFDALIGSYDFKKLGAKIDYKNNVLEIGKIKIPFFIELNPQNFEPFTRKVNNIITIPVNIETGPVIIPEQRCNDITVPESIAYAKDGFCKIPNEIDREIEINFNEQINVEPLSSVNIQNPIEIPSNIDVSKIIRTSYLNAEEKSKILDLCKQYKNIFYDEDFDLTFTNAVKHTIRIVDEEPVYSKSYRYPYHLKEEIQNQIQKLLENKIIRPSISPYSSPVWIVPKKLDASGKRKWRLVIDYRKLNEKTVEDKYPFPRIEEILDNLGKCVYFTTLDLAQGFHQIEMSTESVEKTAFSVNNGHFEYARMPFQEHENKEEYIIDVPFEYVVDERGLGCQYFDSMKKYRNLVAQYIVETEEEDKYGDLLIRSIRTAIHLKSRNISKDDVVVLCSYNHKNSVVPFIACQFLSIPVASLDPSLSKLDMTHLLNEVKPKILFIVKDCLETVQSSLTEIGVEAEIVIYGESEKTTQFEEFLEPTPYDERFYPEPVPSLRDTAVIFFSSGTTGLPKGIVTSHYALMGQNLLAVHSGNIGTVLLTYASLYWISAVLFFTCNLYQGGARVICSSYSPTVLWTLIEKYRITGLALAPTQAIDMLKVGRPEGLDTTSLWTCMVGGAAIAEKHILELRDLLPGAFVFQVYGQSEVAGILTMFKTSDVRETLFLTYKPSSTGLPVAGISYKVVDVKTERICGPNELGELRVKTKFVMNSYYGRDSSETFDSDGWLRTGDIVYYDEDHCFYIVDRIKEMLKYKSWHVPPAMIEQILTTHPAITRTVVIGIPHEEDGDHPMAIVVLNHDYNRDITEEDIERFVADRAPDRMKLRGGVKFVEKIAVTPSGKMKRKEIRDMILRGEI